MLSDSETDGLRSACIGGSFTGWKTPLLIFVISRRKGMMQHCSSSGREAEVCFKSPKVLAGFFFFGQLLMRAWRGNHSLASRAARLLRSVVRCSLADQLSSSAPRLRGESLRQITMRKCEKSYAFLFPSDRRPQNFKIVVVHSRNIVLLHKVSNNFSNAFQNMVLRQKKR